MTPADVAAEVSETFGVRAAATLSQQPRFAVAVPGGSVAASVFPRLAALNLDWSRLDLTWVDERVVPFSDRESNVGVTRQLLLNRLGSRGPRAILPAIDAGDPSSVALEWEGALIAALGSPPRLDLVILGMGPDGHVASLFSGHPVLAVTNHWTAGITDSPKPPPLRVTLTMATLASAGEIWIVAFGAEKAAAVAAARHDSASALPAARVARAGPPVRWFLDDLAAGG